MVAEKSASEEWVSWDWRRCASEAGSGEMSLAGGDHRKDEVKRRKGVADS